jgi:hypothetical protein
MSDLNPAEIGVTLSGVTVDGVEGRTVTLDRELTIKLLLAFAPQLIEAWTAAAPDPETVRLREEADTATMLAEGAEECAGGWKARAEAAEAEVERLTRDLEEAVRLANGLAERAAVAETGREDAEAWEAKLREALDRLRSRATNVLECVLSDLHFTMLDEKHGTASPATRQVRLTDIKRQLEGFRDRNLTTAPDTKGESAQTDEGGTGHE